MSSTEAPVQTPQTDRLARNSVARFGADGAGLALGAVSSIVTARVLGPAGKGTLAALSFVTLLAIQAASLGLGDAAVVWIGKGRATAQMALSGGIGAVLVSGCIGAVAVLGYSVAQLPLANHWVLLGTITACVTVAISAVAQIVLLVVYAKRTILGASMLNLAAAAITTIGTVAFCAVIHLNVFGGALGSLGAGVFSVVAGAFILRRAGLSLRPRLTRAYLRPALRFGMRTQLANVLAYSSARLDLLIVYALAASSQAGLYSVALTIGTLTGFAAIALSYASFPRMTKMDDREALALTARLTRAGFVLSILLSLALAAIVWPLITGVLGTAYRGAIVPSLVLLGANVLWGGQWLTSRALAARGNPSVLMWSYALNLVAMLAVDFSIVPSLGALGAAIGSVVAAAVGLAVSLGAYHKEGLALKEFIPRPADLELLVGRLRPMLRSLHA